MALESITALRVKLLPSTAVKDAQQGPRSLLKAAVFLVWAYRHRMNSHQQSPCLIMWHLETRRNDSLWQRSRARRACQLLCQTSSSLSPTLTMYQTLSPSKCSNNSFYQTIQRRPSKTCNTTLPCPTEYNKTVRSLRKHLLISTRRRKLKLRSVVAHMPINFSTSMEGRLAHS